MTPAQLRSHCDSLNDEHGTGGQTELAKRLGWSDRTMRRKLAGDSPIDRDEAMAVEHLMECQQGMSRK
ncbi:MAG: hypothetical protein U0835_00015 [Isosphaeraceae bacterium]